MSKSATTPLPNRRAHTRVLLVDSDAHRLASSRRWLEERAGASVEGAATGDEALDILGAAAQQYDAVALWPWLSDDAHVDMAGVLRRCQSPLKLMAVTSRSPAELGRPGRLAGVAVVADDDVRSALLRGLETLIAAGDRVADIVASRRVPPTLTRAWGQAIYGAGPGQTFTSPLD